MNKKLAVLVAVSMASSLAFGAALTGPRDTKAKANTRINVSIKTGVTIYAGALVAVDATGYAIPASDATGLTVIGRATKTVAAGSAASGTYNMDVEQGVFWYASDVGTKVKNKIGSILYIVDDQTVSATNSGSYAIVAGIMIDYDAALGQVAIQIGNYAATVASTPASLAVSGTATVGSTLGVTGPATFTGNAIANELDARTATALLLGKATATSVTIGASDADVSIPGALVVTGTSAASGFKIGATAGLTCSITNISTLSTNIENFIGGILTSKTVVP